MSNWLKDAGENVYEWWKKEKISGTVMPIFLILNILKFESSGTNYTQTELIANGFFLVVMIYAIQQYYVRGERVSKEEERTKIELAKVKVESDKQVQKKQVEDFAMNVMKKEKTFQYNLIAEQAEFVTDQIVQKTDHIVFLTKHFNMQDEFTLGLIATHEMEIEELRAYQKILPRKIEQKYDDYIMGVNEIPQTSSVPVQLKSELKKTLENVLHNTELQNTIDGIEEDQS